MLPLKMSVLQAKPKLCLSAEDFIAAIDADVAEAQISGPHDVIVFPEALGMWMCLMEPASFLSKLFSRFLPRHKNTAKVAASGISAGWSDDASENLLAALQFTSPVGQESVVARSVGILSGDEIKTGSLHWVADYRALAVGVKQDTAFAKAGWLERVSTRIFNFLHLKFVGMKLRSAEQLKVYKEAFSSAAKKHGVYIQAGSIFVLEGRTLKNIAFVFDPEGKEIAAQEKVHPIPFETMLGVVSGGGNCEVFDIKGHKCGIAICADVNFPNDHVQKLKDAGCEVVFCPSGGIVPSHRWKWDFDKDIGAANLARSLESEIVIGRAYNAGDLIPDILMFQGRSSITGPKEKSPNKDGLIALVPEDFFRGQCHLSCDV